MSKLLELNEAADGADLFSTIFGRTKMNTWYQNNWEHGRRDFVERTVALGKIAQACWLDVNGKDDINSEGDFDIPWPNFCSAFMERWVEVDKDLEYIDINNDKEVHALMLNTATKLVRAWRIELMQEA